MGWTVRDASHSPKTRDEERAEIVRLYTGLVPEAPCTAECLMASKVGSTWYLAVKLNPKPGTHQPPHIFDSYVPSKDGSITYAGVALTSHERGEWGYKDMCETMGPWEASAPLALLALLSPLAPGGAEQAESWRRRVREGHEARRGRLRVRPGERIEVDEPFTFQGTFGTFASARFEAFSHKGWGKRRARTLYRTLDTGQPQVVAISAKALAARGARRIEVSPGDAGRLD